MGARSSRATPESFWASAMSMAPWLAAPASRRPNSSPLSPLAVEVTSLMLSISASRDRRPTSTLNSGERAVPTAPGPAGGQAPLGQGGRGVLDALKPPAGDTAPPAGRPAGPQVPRSQ